MKSTVALAMCFAGFALASPLPFRDNAVRQLDGIVGGLPVIGPIIAPPPPEDDVSYTRIFIHHSFTNIVGVSGSTSTDVVA